MKSLKVKLSLLAMVIGLGSAFATVKAQDPDRKWSKDLLTGAYSDVTGQSEGFDYSCEDGDDVCTATYPAGINPNDNPSHVQPIEIETGVFN